MSLKKLTIDRLIGHGNAIDAAPMKKKSHKYLNNKIFLAFSPD